MKKLTVLVILGAILLTSGCIQEEITIEEITWSCNLPDGGTRYRTYSFYEGVDVSYLEGHEEDFEWLKKNDCEYHREYTEDLFSKDFSECEDYPRKRGTHTYHITHDDLLNMIKCCKSMEELL